jgi:uncharacterized membrane protein
MAVMVAAALRLPMLAIIVTGVTSVVLLRQITG